MMSFLHSGIQAKHENTPLQLGDAAVRIDHSGDHPMVAVTGRVTVDSTPRFRSVLIGLLRENASGVLVIDLSGVSHLDTSAFAALLEVLSRFRERSMRLRVIGMHGQPRRLAELAQFEQIFTALGSEVVFS